MSRARHRPRHADPPGSDRSRERRRPRAPAHDRPRAPGDPDRRSGSARRPSRARPDLAVAARAGSSALRFASLPLDVACRVARVLGLAVSMRCYPAGLAGPRRRTAGRSWIASSPLVARPAAHPARGRPAWPGRAARVGRAIVAEDGVAFVDAEARLGDVQALAAAARAEAPRRPAEPRSLILVVARTRHNVEVLRLHREALRDAAAAGRGGDRSAPSGPAACRRRAACWSSERCGDHVPRSTRARRGTTSSRTAGHVQRPLLHELERQQRRRGPPPRAQPVHRNDGRYRCWKATARNHGSNRFGNRNRPSRGSQPASNARNPANRNSPQHDRHGPRARREVPDRDVQERGEVDLVGQLVERLVAAEARPARRGRRGRTAAGRAGRTAIAATPPQNGQRSTSSEPATRNSPTARMTGSTAGIVARGPGSRTARARPAGRPRPSRGWPPGRGGTPRVSTRHRAVDRARPRRDLEPAPSYGRGVASARLAAWARRVARHLALGHHPVLAARDRLLVDRRQPAVVVRDHQRQLERVRASPPARGTRSARRRSRRAPRPPPTRRSAPAGTATGSRRPARGPR